MKHLIDGKEVNIDWERHDIIDRHDHETHWSMFGIGDDGNEYQATGIYMSGDLEDVEDIELKDF